VARFFRFATPGRLTVSWAVAWEVSGPDELQEVLPLGGGVL
jgi:hypothetical protein